MSKQSGRVTSAERKEIKDLIKAFDNHGCSLRLDLKAHVALRRLLEALDPISADIVSFLSCPLGQLAPVMIANYLLFWI